ncbi:hypothetical protein FOL47_010516 [Perkinsus chesapeaki]|uniref:Uncharacterized protein n=2 Tax=Alveolata TaxID=33630 RepID=A0A7J6MPM9_PERCH|nr:hypothetical protein FOL47_010516 [Perkinsus chesapeaki]
MNLTSSTFKSQKQTALAVLISLGVFVGAQDVPITEHIADDIVDQCNKVVIHSVKEASQIAKAVNTQKEPRTIWLVGDNRGSFSKHKCEAVTESPRRDTEESAYKVSTTCDGKPTSLYFEHEYEALQFAVLWGDLETFTVSPEVVADDWVEKNPFAQWQGLKQNPQPELHIHYEKGNARLRRTTPCDTTIAPEITTPSTTTDIAPTRNVTNERRFGTYSWSQDYWRKGDPSLINFGASDIGKLWNSGDVYVNIADNTNPDRIHDAEKLLPFMKEWRQRTGNDQRLWLTYGDTKTRNGSLMLQFLSTFEQYLEDHIMAEDMQQVAPIGLSFDAERMSPDDILKTLLTAQQIRSNVTAKMGYAPNSLLFDFTLDAHSPLGTQYIMQYADHATMMLYRNAIDGDYKDDLLYRMNYMMTEQCEVCTQPGWENLKAKITIMLEGSCTLDQYCWKLSMCAYDSTSYPDPSGGIEYSWNLLNDLKTRTVAEGILSQEQFDSLFDVDGSLYAIHDWEWVRCYYGGDFSEDMGFSNCKRYTKEALRCSGATF